MATVLIGQQAIGHFLADSYTAPTALYFYPQVQCALAECEALYGRRDDDGSIVDGEITDWFQDRGTSKHAVNLTTVTVTEDTDSASPYYGFLRLYFVVADSVA